MPNTTAADMIIPEVLADLISAQIPGKLAVANTPAVTVMTDLEAKPGDTITLPRWGAIGDFTQLAEATDTPTATLSTSSKAATCKVLGRGVDLTDEALLYGAGDPMQELAKQFAKYAARALDAELVAQALTTTLVKDASAGTITLNAIADGLDLWSDEQDDAAVFVVHPKVMGDLRKLPEFRDASTHAHDLIKNGVVGTIFGVPVMMSRFVNQNVDAATNTVTYDNLLLKSSALGLFWKRRLNVRVQPNERNRTVYVGADIVFATAMFDSDPVGVVKLVTQ